MGGRYHAANVEKHHGDDKRGFGHGEDSIGENAKTQRLVVLKCATNM